METIGCSRRSQPSDIKCTDCEEMLSNYENSNGQTKCEECTKKDLDKIRNSTYPDLYIQIDYKVISHEYGTNDFGNFDELSVIKHVNYMTTVVKLPTIFRFKDLNMATKQINPFNKLLVKLFGIPPNISESDDNEQTYLIMSASVLKETQLITSSNANSMLDSSMF
jgi:hypothetical protein